MTAAQHPILAASIGQTVTRGVFLTDGQIHSSLTPTTRGDLVFGLSNLSKELEKIVGSKISPDKVVVSARQSDLNELVGKIEAEFIPEDRAISVAERQLSQKLGSGAAILDLGPSAFLDRYPAEEIARWLPFPTNLTDVENHLANKRLFPRAVPVSRHEYEIDLAVARQAIIKLGEKRDRDFLEIENQVNLVLTGGLMAALPNVADLMGIVLDSFYFKSGVTVYQEMSNNLVALGAALESSPNLTLDLTASLKKIGSAIHLGGSGKLSADLGFENKQRLSLDMGEIAVLPAGIDDRVKLSVGEGKVSRHFELGGGLGGIYLDNRSRPLGLAPSSKESIGKILAWRKAISSERLVTAEEGK